MKKTGGKKRFGAWITYLLVGKENLIAAGVWGRESLIQDVGPNAKTFPGELRGVPM